MKSTLPPAASIQPREQLKIFHYQKKLIDCLELLSQSGIQGSTAIFILSTLNQ